MIEKSRLGPFVLEQRLGRQSKGSVYHAVHLQRRRAMAVRIMTQHLGHSGTTIQEFAREVEFLKTLEHPHVVRVYGGGVFDDEAYLAMELVQGDSLDDLLASGGRLPWQTVVDYATQAAEGLEYAHQRGTIHQNLTTAKLILAASGKIKITDFRGNRLNEYDRWEVQPNMATASYLAPEQLRGEKNITQKADLYSLGCVIFELLTGRLPFEAKTVVELREKHLNETPPRVSAMVFDCPIWLDALVAQLLEKDPNKRPHYASAVSLALQEVRHNVNTGIVEHAVFAGSSALKPQADTEVKRLLKRKPASRRETQCVPFYERAWFLVGCAALVLGLCTWAFWPASEEQLFAKAQELMATGDRIQWQSARDRYLLPLLERFPQGKHAEEAREFLEHIELTTAQVRMENNLKLGRRGKSEGERRYAEAWKLEQDGDLPEALAAYEEVLNEVQPKGDDAHYLKLAQQRIELVKPAVKLAAASRDASDSPSATGDPGASRTEPEATPDNLAPMPTKNPPAPGTTPQEKT